MRADNAAKAAGRRTARGKAAQARQAAGTHSTTTTGRNRDEHTGFWRAAGGLLAGGAAAKEAEGSPAIKNFANKYAKMVKDSQNPQGKPVPRLMTAGTLDERVFEEVAQHDPQIQHNKVIIGPHAGSKRSAVGEMEPLEVGQHIENLLNSPNTRVLPNFPSSNSQQNARLMLYLDDGRPVVMPFVPGKHGELIGKTRRADRENAVSAGL